MCAHVDFGIYSIMYVKGSILKLLLLMAKNKVHQGLLWEKDGLVGMERLLTLIAHNPSLPFV